MPLSANKKLNLSVYTILHFIVDLSCIFYLSGMIYVRMPSGADIMKSAIIYNMFAFALPMLLGYFVDLIGKNAMVSFTGCFLILMAYITYPGPWLSVALIGVGNGLFHVGGGRQVLMDSREKYAPSGIFIASGALGVYFGKTMASYYKAVFYTGMWILLVLALAILLLFGIKQWKISVRSKHSKQKVAANMLLISLLIFAVVIIRSYYGYLTRYSWNNGFLMGLVFVGCVFLGKLTGGIIADKLGVTKASIISLAGAGVLVLFAPDSPVCGCISIMLFNMTMPITLSLLFRQWKEFPAFAFGTLMMALFLGTLPNMAFHISWLSRPWEMLILCMVSLLLLLMVIYLEKRKEQ